MIDIYTLMSLKSHYEKKCQEPSDINEHLPTLRAYASECEHVTEMGVRSVVSSYALVVPSVTKRLVQVDIQPMSQQLNYFQHLCAECGISCEFKCCDSVLVGKEPTDLLFIDTWHVYAHLKRELAAWHQYVRKYIIMHDTYVDGVFGESIRLNWNTATQAAETGYPEDEIRMGLNQAIQEFVIQQPEWEIHRVFVNNNGLTILKKKTDIGPSVVTN